jgi:hypothetical protein
MPGRFEAHAVGASIFRSGAMHVRLSRKKRLIFPLIEVN